MLKKTRFSCFLIGDDHLLVQCAEIILANGHIILGIISPLEAAKNLASVHEINYFDSLDIATEVLSTTTFDYLLSIVNSYILPVELLNRAQKLSINFHNAPLPRYAGVHALSWAILNDEPYHGVTWHVMTDTIDGGGILKQTLFTIDPHETALSLSVKCYEHALSLFEELINELSKQTLIPIEQDHTMRSYYDFNQKPPGNGWISWNTSSINIERVIRALDLGHYHHNRLALPKIQLGNEVFIIRKLHVLDVPSITTPGTLIKIRPDAWHISTTTCNVSLEQLVTVDGKSCPLDSIVNAYQLKEGYKLQSPTPHQLEQYQHFSEHYASRELFWVRQLTNFQATLLPFQPQNFEHHADASLTSVAKIAFPSEQISLWEALVSKNFKSTDILLTALLFYLHQMGTKEQLGIWLHASQAPHVESEVTQFFSSLVPFTLSLDGTHSFYETIGNVREMRYLIESKFTFQRDVYYRYPELRFVEHDKYHVALLIGTDKELAEKLLLISASVVITLSSNTNEITWWVTKPLIELEPNLLLIIEASPQHLHFLLKSLPSTIQLPLSQLSMVHEQEYITMMQDWNATTSAYPKGKTISQVFEEQALATPNNTAVSYGKKSLTYSELNQKANQLASYLKKYNLLPNSFAAICTTQELHLIIGILAILKTGAAYIPIDASYPKQHIKLLLEDSKPSVLLASHKLSDRIKQDCDLLNIPVILFNSIAEELDHEPINNLNQSKITPKDLAYIIYTSGTTGKPKGVMVPHQGVIRLVKNTNYIKISERDKIAQAASISFDAATFEIWGALLNGATLIAVSHATLLDVSKFSSFLEEHAITILWLTAALFNQCAAQNTSMFKNLSYLLVGGDVLNKERILSVLTCEQGSPASILNGYGPTENTTFTTIYDITETDKKHQSIPIGKPIANSQVYVLDKQLRPIPIGAMGELYTGGDGLALGYLNRSDLSDEKFITNPFSNEMGSKLYKTGDMVRWMPNGNLEYIGRQDNQVKIRGFRVELEAIQTHLLHHPAISQCSIQALESDKHGKVLVAYIICNDDISDSDLHSFLTHELPTYMIPSFFVRLNRMPLTANGKVNFAKLPKPDFSLSLSRKEGISPGTPLEKSLAILWCNLLGCTNISIDDSFFDLGGHSLLITHLILHVKDTYKIDLPLHVFLENPTIAHLAQLIKGNSSTDIAVNYGQGMLKDRFLDRKIMLQELPHSHFPPKAILLTGASGFLGAHILYDLYRASKSKIYCLIRATDKEDATSRINFTLAKFQLPLQCNERIIPLLGDLTQPQLGLSEHQFDFLSQEVDSIIHNGAAVNHLYNYELLRAANVLSTIEIIHLAIKYKIKPIHYVSTLSAASNYIDDSNCIIEDFIDPSQSIVAPLDGYSQTKWVSEQLLTEISQQGLIVNIYRPGWIVGQSHTGAISAENNHLLSLLKGCIQLKVAPNWDVTLDLLPVDTISAVISHMALRANIKNTVFNLINPNKIFWKELIQYINQRGYPVALIDSNTWKEKHLKYIGKENALYSFYPLYINSEGGDWMNELSHISRAKNYNTSKSFIDVGQTAPPINKDLLDVYFNYLENQGFIKPTQIKQTT